MHKRMSPYGDYDHMGEFINEVNPNYSIISVGKNNRYGHPNKEVLNVLDNSKIYRIDQDGSIMFRLSLKKIYQLDNMF